MNQLKLPQILFELGAAERYEILRLLSLGEVRPSELASKVGILRSEMSRHLSRLEKAGVIEKTANGYRATMLGELAIQHCRGMSFLIDWTDYFKTHMWEVLPKSLLYRVHVFGDVEFLVGVTYALNTIEKMITSSKQYLRVLTHELPHSLIPPTLERIAKGADVKIVLTQNSLKQANEFFKENPQYDAGLLKKATVRIVDSVFSCSAFNETNASTGLLNRADPHEHFSTHFLGNSEGFTDWCREAFNIHEARSKPM